MPKSFTIEPGKQETVDLCIAVKIPVGYHGQMQLRSGVSRGSRLTLRGGLIDPDYSGPLLLSLRNEGRDAFHICENDCVAQLLILPHFQHEAVGARQVTYVCERGDGGHGSTEERKRVHWSTPNSPPAPPEDVEVDGHQQAKANLAALDMHFGSLLTA